MNSYIKEKTSSRSLLIAAGLAAGLVTAIAIAADVTPAPVAHMDFI